MMTINCFTPQDVLSACKVVQSVEKSNHGLSGLGRSYPNVGKVGHVFSVF